MPPQSEPTLVFDNFDIDLLVKVLAHTAFSPFFTFFIPVFYFFQGAKITDGVVAYSAIYYVVVSAIWFLKWISKLYRNQGNLLFGPKPLDWDEQIVVVTGGSSGVGELLANTLAVRNVTVVVLDVKPIQTENYNIAYYKCDVSQWSEVEAVAKRIKDEIGEPTILINNAGVVQGKLILDLSEKDVQQTFGVNTLAHWWTIKAFLPDMLKKKSGHIVSLASVMGILGAPRMTDYGASKAAVISLNDTLRFELDNQYNAPGIRTTVVCPGHILTPLFSTFSVPQNRLYQFFFPSVQPIDVVKPIITALDEQQSQTIMVPFYSQLMPILRLLPSFVIDLAQYAASATHSMANFTKISGRREDEGALKE
ncbi:retinal short-chain dehydrogenase/reductase [Macrolepiota fuliginosa MF-IS2]|uniref:Short-chain dehydrogenase/reductase 3 n=1 Tax=Macrolepiota fuliginosa MF-IS2 TaxID=1400762 RepID=A0A9P5XBC3_9AGAR|nr:retinal short-chain dehydrogenase/reductase [Macrolepiota fuliginosa MF-IS2]